jgi:tRNA A-37 threonylcarbamoyl transferase component Bud32
MEALLGRLLGGRYRVEEYIGGGAAADVYRIWDTQRSCSLAIKVLRAYLSDTPEFTVRFRREAEVLSRLQHPNIVRLYGLEQEGTLLYMVMDFVDGPSLARRLADSRRPLTLDEAVAVTEDLCAALAYAHRSHVYHRDIKPANILLTKQGKALLSDFGIARLTEASSLTAFAIGTPAYMSPEQGQGRELDGRTDIYSLGIVLFEMLAGRPPFVGDDSPYEKGSTQAILYEHANRQPPPLRTFNPAVAPEVGAIVAKALAKSPNGRFQTAEEMAARLREAAAMAPTRTLTIQAPRFAQVTVDGEPRGTGPVTVRGLPDGAHTVRVEAPGFDSYEHTIMVPEVESLTVSLEAQGAAMSDVPRPARPAGGPPRQPPPVAYGGLSGWRGPRGPLLLLAAAAGALTLTLALAVLVVALLAHGGGDEEEGPSVTDGATPKATATPTLGPKGTAAKTPRATATPGHPGSPTPRPTAGTTPTGAGPSDLLSGDVVSISLAEGQTKSWSFYGEAGQLLEVRADRDPTGNVSPGLKLVDPAGEDVFSESDYQARGYLRVSHFLEETGRFRIVLSGGGGSGPATLRFWLDPFTDIEPTVELRESLELPEEIDRFRFQGQPGQLVEIRMVRDPTGPVTPKFTLFNPFGDEIIDEYDYRDTGHLVDWRVLDDAGLFYLAVRASEEHQVGPYTLEVAVDPFIPFAIGQSASGSITKPVQRDRYQFEGTAGQKVYVQVDRDPAGNVTPAFELYDPFWTKVCNEYDWQDDGTVTGECSLKFTGRYTLAVGARGNTQSGGYSVLLEAR